MSVGLLPFYSSNKLNVKPTGMKILGSIHDPVFNPKPYTFADNVFLPFLKDERDLPFIYLTLKITFTLIPLAVLLFMPLVTGWVWGLLAVVYLVLNNIVFKGPYGLMLHCTSHRPLFKPAYKWMNYHLTWVLSLFFGQTPETYFSHHMGMHHPENNLEPDESSTMAYQRDSFRSFLAYFADFFFFGLVELATYLKKKNRMKLFYRALFGEFCFFAMVVALCFVNWAATLVVFILPFVIFRFVAMVGNFTQHAFIDQNDPANPYRNSITCINVKYNHKCWNDGYHISHHYRPALHWTEHPAFFIKTLDKYAKNQAIVFDGLDYMKVFYFLMNKRYDVLAQHVVNVNNTFRDEAELITVLQSRTQRIPLSRPSEVVTLV